MNIKKILITTLIVSSFLAIKYKVQIANFASLRISNNVVVAEDDDDDEREYRRPTPTSTRVPTPTPVATPPQDNTPTPSREDFSSTPTIAPQKPNQPVVKIVPTVKEVSFTEYVNVTDADYAKDTDGDKLVDAIDPDPKRSQLDFFTDTDTDGIPNAFDQFPGKNDFLYRGNLDENANGIVDSYE